MTLKFVSQSSLLQKAPELIPLKFLFLSKLACQGEPVHLILCDFAKSYSKLLGQTINDQLLNSARMIADFWYTAWVDAGKPDLSTLLSQPFEKKDKDALKQENKAWKKNELIEKKMLISRKQAATQ